MAHLIVRGSVLRVTQSLVAHRVGSNTVTCEYHGARGRRFVDVPVEILAVVPQERPAADTRPEPVAVPKPPVQTGAKRK